MDPITHAMLNTLRIEEMLGERQPQHKSGAAWYHSPSRVFASQPSRLRVPVRLRRRLDALLIQAGRRLGDSGRSPGYPLYGPAPR